MSADKLPTVGQEEIEIEVFRNNFNVHWCSGPLQRSFNFIGI